MKSKTRPVSQVMSQSLDRSTELVKAAGAALLLLCLLSAAVFGQGAPSAPFARLTVKSEVLGEDRTILVRTPPGYERNTARYPVLYLTDGDAHIEHTAATVAYLARNGRMPEMILVGVTNTARTRDLTPTRSGMRRHDGQMQVLPQSGGADKFLKFFETELIPRIEREYRTQPYRVFAGHSFGGLFAMHAFLSRPELFHAVIAVSPSLHWDDFLPVRRAEEFFKDRKELERTLYLTLANEGEGMRQGFDRLQALLAKQQTAGFVWGAKIMEDEDHGSVVMRSHYQGLRKIFSDWQVAREPGTGAIAGGVAGVEAHYRKLSKRLGYEVLPPELLINQLGYQLLQGGKIEEAIATFKSNVERYPESANVYDSLGEAYERQGRMELAAPLYEKAYQLGKQSNDPNLETFRTNAERAAAEMKKISAGKSR